MNGENNLNNTQETNQDINRTAMMPNNGQPRPMQSVNPVPQPNSVPVAPTPVGQPSQPVPSVVQQPRPIQPVNPVPQPNPVPVAPTPVGQPSQPVPSAVQQPRPIQPVNPVPQPNPVPVAPTPVGQPGQPVPSAVQQPRPMQPVNPVPQPNPVPVAPTPVRQPSQPVPSAVQQPRPIQPVNPVPQPNPVPVAPTPIEQPTESAKIEFVNPLNPNQVLKTESVSQILEPQMEKPIDTPPTNESNNEEKPKKPKKKLNLTLIAIVLVVAILGIVVYFTFFNKPSKPSSKPNDNGQVATTTLNKIVTNLQNNNDFKQLNFTSVVPEVKNDTLTIKTNANNIESTYIYKLENNILKIEFDQNDAMGSILVLYVFDAAAQITGLKANEFLTYLNLIDITKDKIEGLTYNSKNNIATLSIDLSKKIDTSAINSTYIEENDLNELSEIIKGEGKGSTAFVKGRVFFAINADDNHYTIIVGEPTALSDLTYKSILSFIEFVYPNELETFKTNYPTLKNANFGKYTITLDPTNFDEFSDEFVKEEVDKYVNNNSNYKLIEIKIDKSL